jgi:DNA helicase-2/ATP-dependent DNA helicase PcrA
MNRLRYKKYYKGLNAEQKKAIDAVDGQVLVLAGPGTGKTQLLSVRAANIIAEEKCAPENILILTYTNAATKAMKERLAEILGPAGYEIMVDTFHGFANFLIRDSEEAVDYISRRIQISDIEQIKAFEYILDNYGNLSDIRPFGNPYFYVGEIKRRIGELKNEGVTPEDFTEFLKAYEPDGVYVSDKHFSRLKGLAVCYRAYEELKTGRTKGVFDDRGRYDYEDMIILAERVLKKEPDLKQYFIRQYKYIMVDEYQDTNGAQLKLLLSLCGGVKPNLCCVGDDDQSIYRFQGASVGNFKFLRERFPGLKTVSLKNNYRSADKIVSLYSRIIRSIPEGERTKDKKLLSVRDYASKKIEAAEFTTEDEELCFLVNRVNSLKEAIEKDKGIKPGQRKRPYNEIAVLVRKRKYIPRIINAFLKAGIPYSTDGKEDISGQTRVIQMLDVLGLAHTDRFSQAEGDLLLYKVLSSDYMELPQSDILKLINYVNCVKPFKGSAMLDKFLEWFCENLRSGDGISEKIGLIAPEKLKRAARIIFDLRKNAESEPVHYLLLKYIKACGLYKFILKKYDDDKIIRLRELRSLTSFINTVKMSDESDPGVRLAEFLDEIKTRRTHDMPITGKLVTHTQDGVRILTAHGSKGLEFHSVIIPFCLHEKSWPVKHISDKIPLPAEVYRTRQKRREKEQVKTLAGYDETRLFYVAASRAKSTLTFTATPTEDAVLSPFFAVMGIEVKPHREKDEEEILADFLRVTDREDPFAGLEEVLRDAVKNLKLTPTKLNNYTVCRRKFFYNDVLLLPGKKKQALIFGNCAHKAAESAYREYMQKNTFPDFGFLKKEFMRELEFQGADDSAKAGCRDKFDMYMKKWYERVSRDPVMPLGLENRMIVTLKNNIDFVGKYDKLELEDEADKKVRVIDYKSGAPDRHVKAIHNCPDIESEDCDNYLRQLVAYKLLFDRDKTQNRGFRVSHGVLEFFETPRTTVKKYGLKKSETADLKIEITEEMVEKLERFIVKTWRDINSLRFEKLPERDAKKCGVCDFDEICWGQ